MKMTDFSIIYWHAGNIPESSTTIGKIGNPKKNQNHLLLKSARAMRQDLLSFEPPDTANHNNNNPI